METRIIENKNVRFADIGYGELFVVAGTPFVKMTTTLGNNIALSLDGNGSSEFDADKIVRRVKRVDYYLEDVEE